MSKRMGNIKKSRTFSEAPPPNGTTPSQYLLITKNLVPVAKSVPISHNNKYTPVSNNKKVRSVRPWRRESLHSSTSFLKPPLVSTNGHGFPQSDLQDWIRESRLAIDIDRLCTVDSKCLVKDKPQKPMRIWQKFQQYRGQMKMQTPKEKEELPFPYNPELWKIRTSSSLLSMDSLLIMPQVEITSWESSSITTRGSTEGSNTIEVKSNSGNCLEEKSDNERKCSIVEEPSDSSTSTTVSETIEDNAKFVTHSGSSELHHPSMSSVISKVIDQGSKSNLITSSNESQSRDLSPEHEIQSDGVVSPDNLIWHEIGSLISQVQNEITPARLPAELTTPEIAPARQTTQDSAYACKRKYSWQVMDAELQTSRTLLMDLVKSELERMENEREENPNLKCCCKYSWQIIGIETQTSPKDYEQCEKHFELASTKSRDSEYSRISARRISETTVRKLKFPKYLTNIQTQTCASKENQTNFTEIYAMCRKANAKILA